jgi:hypothetical protein
MEERDKDISDQRPSDKWGDLKALGFEPGWPVMELSADDSPTKLTLELIFDALRTTTYWSPKTIPFVYEQGGDSSESWRLPMVPEQIRAVYNPFAPNLAKRPIGCYDDPSWYLRGHLLHNALNPEPHLDRMHAWIPHTLEDGAIHDVFVVQLVREERPDADASAPLEWLSSDWPPGQF